MQALFETWWYGYLVVPIAIAITIGGFLCVWTGVIIARLVAFDQARMAAIRVTINTLWLSGSRSTADFIRERTKVITELQMLSLEFHRLRQGKAAAYMHVIAARIGEATWSDHTNLSNFGENWNRAVSESAGADLRVYSTMLIDLGPSVYPLITLRRCASSREDVRGIEIKKFIEEELAIRCRQIGPFPQDHTTAVHAAPSR